MMSHATFFLLLSLFFNNLSESDLGVVFLQYLVLCTYIQYIYLYIGICVCVCVYIYIYIHI